MATRTTLVFVLLSSIPALAIRLHGMQDSKALKGLKESIYHECTGGNSEIRMYTVNRVDGGNASVHRNTCVDKKDLDFDPSSSYIILTMANDYFYEHLKQLLTSLGAVPQTGGLPTRLIIVDQGLSKKHIQNLQEVSPVPLEIHDYREQSASLDVNISDMPEISKAPKGEKEDFNAGAPYRLKALVIDEWLHRMTEDQLIWMDAGGIMLGSLHRLRNFIQMEGFYAGTLTYSATQEMFDVVGMTSPEVRAERKKAMTMKGHMPTCFDYESDHLVDETHDADDRPTKMLGSFEAGFIAVDRHHDMPVKLLRTWANIMGNDTLWAEHQGYYFPHDQKILTNEIWKEAICSKEPGTTRLLDVDNVRFGSVARPKGTNTQPFKQGFSLYPDEETPWAGYAYHYCMNPGTESFVVRHPCGIMHDDGSVEDEFPPDGWRKILQRAEKH